MNGERIVELLEAQLVDRVLTEVLDKATVTDQKRLAVEVQAALREMISRSMKEPEHRISYLLSQRVAAVAEQFINTGQMDAQIQAAVSANMEKSITQAVESRLTGLTVETVRALLKGQKGA